MTYLLDSNVFIEAKNHYYGFDFCPAFWDWIDQENAAGMVFSVDSVRNELIGVADELAAWAGGLDGTFFLQPDTTTSMSLRATASWAYGNGYEPGAVSTFLSVADYYLVSQGHEGGHTVVTQEISSSSRRRIKIPNACQGLGVNCVTPFEMLRAEGARFVVE
jgi:hypothetical protein